MIGDTMETDILGGVQMGYQTVLVLSGGTSRDDLQQFAYRPNMVVDSIADLLKAFAGKTAIRRQTPPPLVPELALTGTGVAERRQP